VASINRTVYREFIRRVYREASANTEAARSAYLDGLAETAMSSFSKGRNLVGTSDKGTSATYAMFSAWSPTQIIDLVDFARDYIAEDTVAEALALFAVKPVSGVVNLINRNGYASGLT